MSDCLIAGDSWGEGVRAAGKQLHPGLSAFFQDVGIDCHNISFGGLANSEIIHRTWEHLGVAATAYATVVFFFTCPLREFKFNHTPITDTHSWLSSHWQGIATELGKMKDRWGFKIVAIGGLTDIPDWVMLPADVLIRSSGGVLFENHVFFPFADFRFVDVAWTDTDRKMSAIATISAKYLCWESNKTLMHDNIHPGAKGYELLWTKIQPHINSTKAHCV